MEKHSGTFLPAEMCVLPDHSGQFEFRQNGTQLTNAQSGKLQEPVI